MNHHVTESEGGGVELGGGGLKGEESGPEEGH